MGELVISMLITYGVLVVMMALLWLLYRLNNNAAIVDVGWGLGFVLASVVYFLIGEGLSERKAIISGLVILWGGRLALHLLTDRILSGKPEDLRYTSFREKWKQGIHSKFFYFFQFQALLIAVFSAPIAMISFNPSFSIAYVEWFGIGLWLIGFVGETVADFQLKSFKNKTDNKGRTCQTGLWKYSRHPNYFFEWIVWIGYFFIALGADQGWIMVFAPLGMLYILLKVTGISLTEKYALKSRGEEYSRYQKTTSAFIPLPRRKLRES